MGMLRGSWALSTVLVSLLVQGTSAVSFYERKQNLVYDISPKVRITGTDLATLDKSKLQLSFVPKLKLDTDYKLDIQSSDDGSSYIVLTLQKDKRWAELEAGSGPQNLYITSAKVNGDTVFEDSVQVATVIPTPTVDATNKIIYMGATPKLVINGTNFNPKQTALYFDPPLEESVAFSQQILSSTQISLMKKYDPDTPKTWTEAPGPLKVKAINTGAGTLLLSPNDGGVVVAEVQADLEGHGITVENHEEVNMYQSTKMLEIVGKGFQQGTKIRFANALRGGGTNFTITETLPEKLTLTLEEGSVWRRNPNSLPGALVVLAAEAGAGWVPLGPTGAKAGRKVATVYEDPSIETNEDPIFRTHTHELMIKGTGFTRSYRPVIDFKPALDNFFTEVVNRTTLRMTPSSATSQWTSEDELGPLTIQGVDTGAGMVKFDAPVTVATVVADSAVHESGVQVFPSYGQSFYQSSKGPIFIGGAGFKAETVLVFDPPISSPDDYTLEVVSDTQLKLTLAKESKWSTRAGPLMVKAIDVGDGNVQLAEGQGVKVATILEDPIVKNAELQVYASHTKRFPVRGSGFHSYDDTSQAPKIMLDGIPASNYQVQADWSNTMFFLQLVGEAWVDVAEGETKEIRLVSINTGAGDVDFEGGVVIAEVRPDSTTALCEDSCVYANDGRCDEPRGAQTLFPGGSYSGYYTGLMSPRQSIYGWGYDDDANIFFGTNDYSGMYRYAGYTQTYHSYGMTDDGFYNGMPPCDLGTDCSDCGVNVVRDGACDNTCRHARDGICDDPRLTGVCPSGTDCEDCGPWGDGNSNFTQTSFYSTSWADDDDWGYAADDMIDYGQEMNGQAQYKKDWSKHQMHRKENPGAGTIFVDVLWAMVVLVGCSVSIAGCMVAFRHFKAGGGGAPMYLPVQAAEEVELSRRGASARSEITPDVTRIG